MAEVAYAGGEVFTIITANTATGTFANENLPTLTNPLTWSTSYNTPTGAVKLNISSPLPVEILYFNGFATKNGVLLNWETAAEVNARSFTLQRSADGIDFYAINEQPARGSNSNYSHLDENPLNGAN